MLQDDNWSVEHAMQMVMQHKVPDDSMFPPIKRTDNMLVDEVLLKHCLTYMAKYVESNGDDYLPIFARLKEELEQLRERENLKLYARKLIDDAGF